MKELTGRVAVITGGASGIGLAMAQRFSRGGMRVVLADRDPVALEAAVRSLPARASDVLAVQADVARADEVASLEQAAADAFGNVHVLCNNAGVLRPGSTWEQTADDWISVLGVNLVGVVNGLRSFVPAMLAHGEPCHVINTASAAGLAAVPLFGSYCVSKAAVVALSEAFAQEIALLPGAHMTVSVLCPGSVATGLFRSELHRRSTTREVAGLSPESELRFAAASSTERADQVPPEIIADLVIEAMAQRRFYILPMQASFKETARARLTTLIGELDAAPELHAAL